MCILYEKTISGRAEQELWKSMGYEAAPDPVGKYIVKKGVWEPDKAPVQNPSVATGAARDVPHTVSSGLVIS